MECPFCKDTGDIGAAMLTTGERIRLLRGTKSQAEFGRAIGMSAQQIGNLERAKTTNPSLHTLRRISAYCKVDIAFILKGTDYDPDVL
jgi:transcriptional regulator with XRE-family HTH domain